MARLVELGAEMEQKGVDFDGKSPAEVQAFYDETVASLDARDGELNDANELQTRNAALQAAFGEPAQVLSAWMEQTRQDAAGVVRLLCFNMFAFVFVVPMMVCSAPPSLMCTRACASSCPYATSGLLNRPLVCTTSLLFA